MGTRARPTGLLDRLGLRRRTAAADGTAPAVALEPLGQVVVLRLVGDLDELATLDRWLRAASAGTGPVVVDLTAATAFPPAALTAIRRLARALDAEGRQLRIAATPGTLVERVLIAAHVDRLAPIDETPIAAAQALGTA